MFPMPSPAWRDLLTGDWSYHPAADCPGGEVGLWDGGAPPPLRPHFHDQDQMTLIIEGTRHFLVAGKGVTLSAGEALLFPAGTLHQALAGPRARCVNLYRLASTGSTAPRARERRRTRLLALGSATAAATEEGRSREGYSRSFRRENGASPRFFSIADRLSHARALLRDGCPVVDAALESGFSDQSHLGRLFRQAFGTTPARYRRSHSFQTRPESPDILLAAKEAWEACGSDGPVTACHIFRIGHRPPGT